jgi:hypothetical protein
LRLSNSRQQHVRKEKLAENDLTYFYLRHVVIVVTAVTTTSLTPVIHAFLSELENNLLQQYLRDILAVILTSAEQPENR